MKYPNYRLKYILRTVLVFTLTDIGASSWGRLLWPDSIYNMRYLPSVIPYLSFDNAGTSCNDNNNNNNHWAFEFVEEIGRRTTLITGDSEESTFLFQQLSIALQRGNAVAFLDTFDSD